MASIITATTTSGLTQSADNSGVLQLASGTGNLVTVPSVTGTAMVSGNMPAFSVYRSGNQSISSSVFTKMQFNAEEWDTANCFDTTNNRFTPNVAGYYQISASVSWSFTSGLSFPVIYKNNAAWKYGNLQPATSAGCIGNLTAMVYLNGTTDYIELFVYQTNGTNNYATGSGETYWQGFLARAA